MRKITRALTLCAALLWAASHSAEASCMLLGWSTGPNSQAQWTKASVEERGDTVTIHYDSNNGVMRGTIQGDGTLRGNWIEDKSKGGLFMFRKPQSGKAEGWWTYAGENKRYPMMVQACP